MTVMRRMLSKVGIGGIEVDTILERESLVVGEEMKGIVKIKGSSMKQTIDGVHLTLSMKFVKYLNRRDIHTRFDLHRLKIANKFVIQPDELIEIPFSFIVPNDTPITLEQDLVWVHTNLDIKNAINPQDIDYIKVIPNSDMQQIINKLDTIGFVIHTVELIETPKQFKLRLPFVQEVIFVPVHNLSSIKIKIIPLNNDEFNIEILHHENKRSAMIISSNDISQLHSIMKDVL